MNDYACGELLAVDPGLNKPAACLMRGGKIVAAERVRVEPGWADLEIGERAARVAEAIVRWGVAHEMEPRTVVYEKPVVYRARKSKGDPNDLVNIALVAANLTGMLRVLLGLRGVSLRILSPEPAEWIGQIPKAEKGDPWSSPRGIRIRSRLDPEILPDKRGHRPAGPEFNAIIPSHDAVDAVGLALFAVGRLVQRRVYAGAVDTLVAPEAAPVPDAEE